MRSAKAPETGAFFVLPEVSRIFWEEFVFSFKKLKPVLLVLCLFCFYWTVCEAKGLPWKTGKKQGNFLVMSDIHFDPYADPSLVKKLAAAPVEDWETLFASSDQKDLCPYGKDTNYPLFKSTLQAAAARGPYDYVIATGDFISHHFRADFLKLAQGDDQAYRSFVLKTVQYVTRAIRKAVKGAPAYFCLGNNDSDYNDYGGLYPGSPFLPTLAKEWPQVAQDPQAVEDFSQGGYCVMPHPTMKDHEIVVLNDVFWSYKYDPFSAFKKGEFGPNGPQEQAELKWLAKVLADAKSRKLKVTILTHIPPGVNGRSAAGHEEYGKSSKTYYGENYIWPFLNELAFYRDAVDGEFCGHTHMDDFRVVRDHGGKPVLFAHMCPAVSPVRNNNPGFQAMLYDKKNGALLDMATYYLSNMGTAGPSEPAKWELEYDFDQAYGLKSYGCDSLLSLAKAIEEDPAIRAKYIQYVPVSSTNDPPCTMEVWKYFCCATVNLDPPSYKECCK